MNISNYYLEFLLNAHGNVIIVLLEPVTTGVQITQPVMDKYTNVSLDFLWYIRNLCTQY